VSGRDGVVSVDQTAVRGSRRSNPATCTGLLDPIRKAFAKANGVKPALFSANSEGACPACNGAGILYTDLGVMAGVATTCEVCEGRRFDASVLEHRLGGLDIAEVLALSVTAGQEFFGAGEARTPAALAVLDRLVDVEQLLGLLDRLVDAGRSVIVIEHHQAVMAHADWIIDLGPGAGHDGGRIVFEGTPADLVVARSTLTGEHLAAYIGT
jgi:excinuclease UvrABC ATPase subunit